MSYRRSYLILLLLSCMVFYACGRDRRSRVRHAQINETEVSVNSKQDSSVFPKTSSNELNPEIVNLLIPAMPSYVSSQILERKGYITSYNKTTLCPNWVAWSLSKEHADGPYTRNGVPYYDEQGSVYGIGQISDETMKNGYIVDLESDKPRQNLSDWSRDYNMSHGHMCPAGDNKWDKAAMNQSFLLTNMCPQDEKLNSGGWNRLEEKCRTWANLYGYIYIITGPVFYKEPNRFLGQIAIPDAFFKVVLRNTDSPRAIGFIYENSSISQSINSNCCTIDHVEEITGFDFFEILNDNIEDAIESQCSINDWK